MSARRSLLIVSLLFVAQVVPVVALSAETVEASALRNIGHSIESFESKKGRLPENWKELDTEWKMPLDDVFRQVLPTRRYELYSRPLVLKLHNGRSLHVVAITRKPTWKTITRRGLMGFTAELKGPGRYVLHREEVGDMSTKWFDEAEIERLWLGTGQALPVPDQEPERAWVKEARRQIMMRRLAIGAAVVLLVGWIAVRWKGRRLTAAVT